MEIRKHLNESVKAFRKEHDKCELAKEIADDIQYALLLSETVALSFLTIWANATDTEGMTSKDKTYYNYAKQIYSQYNENRGQDE